MGIGEYGNNGNMVHGYGKYVFVLTDGRDLRERCVDVTYIYMHTRIALHDRQERGVNLFP